jgi:Zn-dependent peptidase ImmA (M78 family)
MALRRGFKSEANDIAREVRAELGLELLEPLDASRLAAHLAIDTLPMSELSSDAPRAVRHFGVADISAFSAVTVFRGTQRLIVYNDSHSIGRQASDVTHECSHALLLHPPVPALDGAGCRNWDATLEDEAQWLAGALLITEEAALSIVRQATPLAAAAIKFGVSETMVRFRVNVSGAHKRVARARGQHAS